MDSAGGVQFGAGCLLALVVLWLYSRRPSADRPQPAGAVVAVPSADLDAALMESHPPVSGALLSSVILALDAGH